MVLASVFLFSRTRFSRSLHCTVVRPCDRSDPVIMRQDSEKWVGLFSLFIWGQVCSAIENFELKRISFEKLVRHPSYTGHRTLLTEAWYKKLASENFSSSQSFKKKSIILTAKKMKLLTFYFIFSSVFCASKYISRRKSNSIRDKHIRLLDACDQYSSKNGLRRPFLLDRLVHFLQFQKKTNSYKIQNLIQKLWRLYFPSNPSLYSPRI